MESILKVPQAKNEALSTLVYSPENIITNGKKAQIKKSIVQLLPKWTTYRA
jgi:hypothetical protein